MQLTSEVLPAAHKAEEVQSQALGFKAKTADGKIAVYTKAAADIAENTACLVLADGTCALKGTGLSCKSEYPISKGMYGYVLLQFTEKTVS